MRLSRRMHNRRHLARDSSRNGAGDVEEERHFAMTRISDLSGGTIESDSEALGAAQRELDQVRTDAAALERRLSAENERLRDELARANARLLRLRQIRSGLRRVRRAFIAIAFAPLDLVDGIRARTYRPRLIPINDLRALSGGDYEWESIGDDPQFLITPPIPRGLVRLRLKGRASPDASVTLYTSAGDQVAEPGLALGVLTAAGSTFEHIVDLSHVWSARLDPALGPGQIAIEELSLQRLSVWREAVDLTSDQVVGWSPLVVRLLAGLARSVRRHGLNGIRRATLSELRERSRKVSKYDTWMRRHTFDDGAKRRLLSELARCIDPPVVSLFVDVREPVPSLLTRSVESVRDQLYPRWELYLRDSSNDKEIRSLLEAYASNDRRIKIIPADEDDPSVSDRLLASVAGEFIGFVAQHDELSPDALVRAVLFLATSADADVIYTDRDEIDESGNRANPFFKPGWSPETLLAHMYLSGLCLYRKSIVQRAGGLPRSDGEVGEHDLALRVTETTANVHRVPHVLYHARAWGSASDRRTSTETAGIDVVARALTRRGIAGTVDLAGPASSHYIARLTPNRERKISIIIPTRDRADLLDRCLESLFVISAYPNFDACVVDNGSSEQATSDVLARFAARFSGRFQVLRRDVPFNFSALINDGVAATDGDLVVFLNNDTEVIASSWLDDMAGYAQQREIGAVGCVLLYPNGSVQYGGVVLGRGGVAGHAHVGEPASAPGYFGRLAAQSNCAAVTAACMMVRRDVFAEIGGFDQQLTVAFNDVDFCLKAISRGYRNVCLGQVRLVHHESASRGSDDAPKNRERAVTEFNLMRRRWAALLDSDPYYNPNLHSTPPTFEPFAG